ncbi:MAG: hypothetical protein RR466_03800 [Hungatella sp.]
MNQGYHKILIFCNTYMQIINAIQIKVSFFKSIQVDLIVSDHSRNAKNVVGRLEESGLFGRVAYVDTKYIDYQQSLWEDLKDVFSVNFGRNKKYKDFLWREDFTYDLILIYNISMLVYSAYDELVKKGIKPSCMRYEEGINCYQDMAKAPTGKRNKMTEIIRKSSSKKNLLKHINEVFCYFPMFFSTENKWKVNRIPPLRRENQEFIRRLNTIFDYSSEKDKFPQKYIYFATSSDIDGNSVGETDLVLQLGEILGEENLMIKVHPRDTRTVYEDAGLQVNRNSDIPWEVIQLNHDFSNYIFISLSSGSVLTASAMLGDDIESYYLFPVVAGKNTNFDEHSANVLLPLIEKLHNANLCTRCKCLQNIDELRNIKNTRADCIKV